MTEQKLVWQDVEGLPDGARIQQISGIVYVFFRYPFRHEDGTSDSERDYIGTVQGKTFVPNLYYVQNHPEKSKRPPEKWKDPIQRAKAMAAAQMEKAAEESSDWKALELEADDKEDTVRQVGASALAAEVLYKDELVDDVARALGYDLPSAMNALNLAMHAALTAKASYLASSESEVTKFIGGGCLKSQRISEFLGEIGKNLSLTASMTRLRMASMTSDGDLLGVDGTFLDCNSERISAAHKGKRKDGTYGPQINLSMVVNATTGVPVGYRWYSGDTHDGKTLEDLKEIWKDSKIAEKDVTFIWDRAYYGASRLAELDREGIKFIAGAKSGLNIIKDILKEGSAELHSPSSQLRHDYSHGITRPVPLGGKADGATAYVYYSPNKRMVATRDFRAELEAFNQKWQEGKAKKDDARLKFFKEPHVWKQPLTQDEDAFDKECDLRGIFAFVSNTAKQTSDEMLEKYRLRNEAEVLFRLMSDHLLKTTRVHSSQVLEGLLFVVFIALSVLGRLRKSLQNKVPSHKNILAAQCPVMDFDTKTYSLNDYVTLSELFSELRGITATVSKSTGKARLSNLTKKKKELVNALGYEGLLDSADKVWELLSARHLSERIRAVKAKDEAAAAEAAAKSQK